MCVCVVKEKRRRNFFIVSFQDWFTHRLTRQRVCYYYSLGQLQTTADRKSDYGIKKYEACYRNKNIKFFHVSTPLKVILLFIQLLEEQQTGQDSTLQVEQ